MTRHIPAFVYLACLPLMSVVGLYYETLSAGLAMPMSKGPLFCRDLLSAGGDDDAMIAAFRLFLLPLALRVIRINRSVASAEVVVLLLCAALAVFALYLASLDCAALFYTAFVLPDPYLAAAMIGLPLSVLSLLYLRHSQ